MTTAGRFGMFPACRTPARRREVLEHHAPPTTARVSSSAHALALQPSTRAAESVMRQIGLRLMPRRSSRLRLTAARGVGRLHRNRDRADCSAPRRPFDERRSLRSARRAQHAVRAPCTALNGDAGRLRVRVRRWARVTAQTRPGCCDQVDWSTRVAADPLLTRIGAPARTPPTRWAGHCARLPCGRRHSLRPRRGRRARCPRGSIRAGGRPRHR